MQKFEETGSIGERVSLVHPRCVRLAENITAVNDSVAEDPELAIHHRSHNFSLSYGSL